MACFYEELELDQFFWLRRLGEFHGEGTVAKFCKRYLLQLMIMGRSATAPVVC